MTVGRRAILWLAALLALLGVAGTPGAALAKPRLKRIHGTYRFRGSLLLRRSEVFLVTKSVKIVAGGGVTIAGKVELSPGTALTIKAHGPIRNEAPIVGLKPSKRKATLANGSGCPDTNVVEDAFSSVVVDRPMQLAGGLTGPDGNGCPGGSIKEVSRAGNIEINAAIDAGAGGPGRSSRTHVRGGDGPCHTSHRPPGALPTGGETFVRGGNGGDGGNIRLTTINVLTGGISGNISHVHPGAGGSGGAAVGTAPGGATNRSGGNIGAVSGNGGDGGTGTLEELYAARRNVIHHTDRGRGGSPGGAEIAAGGGGAPNCDGGDAALIVGHHGTGDGKAPGLAEVKIAGGNASQSAALQAEPDGGRGGDVRVYGGEIHGAKAPWAHLDIGSAGTGGPGFNGCSTTPPSPGGHGGSGGTLSLSGHAPGFVVESFKGGRGGDGQSPGLGGLAGTNNGRSLQIIKSFLNGPDGVSCPLPRVSYSDHPFKDIGSWVAGGSTVDPAEPHDVFALGVTSGGVYKVVDFSTLIDGPNPAFGGGTGEITLPAPPNANGYRGLSRPAAGVIGVWAPSGTTHLVYALFNDAGVAQGSTNVSTGTAIFSAPEVFNFRTGGGGLFVVAADVDSVSHNPGLGTFAVATTGEVSAGPCPTPTIFPHTDPTLSSVAYDPAAGRFFFAGLFNSFTDTGFFSTDGSCANATSPVSLGANAGQTLPAVIAAGGGNAFVLGGVPAPNNDQRLALYKIYADQLASGFTTWLSPPGVQAFPNSLFLDDGDVVGVGDLGGKTLKIYLNAGTGAPDPTYRMNPFLFTTAGSTFSVVQTAQEPVPGTFVIFSNDSGLHGGIDVITG